jgi:hypothetical protein
VTLVQSESSCTNHLCEFRPVAQLCSGSCYDGLCTGDTAGAGGGCGLVGTGTGGASDSGR